MQILGIRGAEVRPVAGEIGGKAANLARLHQLGLRVPPAVALETSIAREFAARGCLPHEFRGQLVTSLARLEAATGLGLGGPKPLVLSVRSSPPVSMPGMLESVVNVGLNEEGVSGLIRQTGNPWLAWDTYRRLVLSFAGAVRRQPLAAFVNLETEVLDEAGVGVLQDLDPLAMRDLARRSADLLARLTGTPLPEDPLDQVEHAVEAVMRSWAMPRAAEYRRLNHLDEATGTGVLIQAMVFGNSGPRSGSGVGFTRNPATGDDEMYIDFMFNCQGEDVVSGRRALTDGPSLATALPGVWAELGEAKSLLEEHFRDMQDVEFTVDNGQLYFLQTRTGKRTPWAALHIATALVAEGLLQPAEALERLAPIDLDRLAHVMLRPGPNQLPIARATTASAGVASGAVVFDSSRAIELAAGQPVILCRTSLATDDLPGLTAATGLLTTLGGRTSHAAVVARQLGIVCLVGCGELRIDERDRWCTIGEKRVQEGDIVTLDGDHGFVYADQVPVVRERPDEALATIARWRRLTGTPALA